MSYSVFVQLKNQPLKTSKLERLATESRDAGGIALLILETQKTI